MKRGLQMKSTPKPGSAKVVATGYSCCLKPQAAIPSHPTSYVHTADPLPPPLNGSSSYCKEAAGPGLVKSVSPRVLATLRWARRGSGAVRSCLKLLEDPRGRLGPQESLLSPLRAQPFPSAQAQRIRSRPGCPLPRWQRRRP